MKIGKIKLKKIKKGDQIEDKRKVVLGKKKKGIATNKKLSDLASEIMRLAD